MITYLFMVEVLNISQNVEELPEIDVHSVDVQATSFESAVKKLKQMFNNSTNAYHQSISAYEFMGEFTE